jgi:hypothetical protein
LNGLRTGHAQARPKNLGRLLGSPLVQEYAPQAESRRAKGGISRQSAAVARLRLGILLAMLFQPADAIFGARVVGKVLTPGCEDAQGVVEAGERGQSVRVRVADFGRLGAGGGQQAHQLGLDLVELSRLGQRQQLLAADRL